MRLGCEVEYGQFMDQRIVLARSAADVASPDHAGVHTSTGDILADALHDEHVDLCEGQFRRVRLGNRQETSVGGGDILRLSTFDDGSVFFRVFNDADGVGDGRCGNGDSSPFR